jgi:hypothetical protein
MLSTGNEIYAYVSEIKNIPDIKPVISGRELNALARELAALLAVTSWEQQLLVVRKPTQALVCDVFHTLPHHFAALHHADQQERMDLLARRKTFTDLFKSYLQKLTDGHVNGNGHIETLIKTLMTSPIDDDTLVAIGHIVGKERMFQAAVAVEDTE